MEASTSIQKMLAGNQIFVPNYQRAYSWDTEFERSSSPKQVNIFLSDLEDYKNSCATSKFYFGHFLFEEKSGNRFAVIDGQQRLTTIIIFLSSIFSRLKEIRNLTEQEEEVYEDIIKRKSTYRFESVDYDKQLFRDYIIDKSRKDISSPETESAKRIIAAYRYFTDYLKEQDEDYLLKMLEIIQYSSCTTHIVQDECEAIQMFIFQNNRGKRPSNLEIIKAQFLFHIHLYGNDEKEVLIDEIKNRFEKIYKSISSIETLVNEDDILTYTLRVYFNSLWENNALERINKCLAEKEPLSFIRNFSLSLAQSFEDLTIFYGRDEKDSHEIHAIVTLRRIGVIMPFILKAYSFNLDLREKARLCKGLESIVLRHRLIGTRADITSRLNQVYQNFTEEDCSVDNILEHINWLKEVSSDHWWWAYWNNNQLKDSIQGGLNHSIAKYILWKYENYLEAQGKGGYNLTRFDAILNPELEHIAPQTENPESGYDEYDDEFRDKYLDCLGNYLLVSKSHNCSVGNKPFTEKRKSYRHLEQQREIQEMTQREERWTRERIEERKNKIIKFILSEI